MLFRDHQHIAWAALAQPYTAGAMEMAMREDPRRKFDSDMFGWDTAIVTIWTVLIAVMLVGSTYHRLGRPALDAALQAEAAPAASATISSSD